MAYDEKELIELARHSEYTRPVASIEMLCGDTWNVMKIYTNFVPNDELREICRHYAKRNPGVEYRFRYGTIHFSEEFEIVKVE